MNKFGVIQARLEGKSYRQISKELSIDRKTVKRYWEEYCLNRREYFEDSSDPLIDKDHLLLKMIEAPKYDSSNRSKRKYTSDIDTLVSTILEAELKK
ncbi:MAG: helix-turn-helix domain-containing protein, partial [Erysipelothrix sp.]|nr:helix-turn-helix domain-containing protein [Erysipelothrix sp.]